MARSTVQQPGQELHASVPPWPQDGADIHGRGQKLERKKLRKERRKQQKLEKQHEYLERARVLIAEMRCMAARATQASLTAGESLAQVLLLNGARIGRHDDCASVTV